MTRPLRQRTDDDREALRIEALTRTRTALRRARGLCGALEHLLEALGAGDAEAQRTSTEALRQQRRASEEALLDAQELADRTLDSMG